MTKELRKKIGKLLRKIKLENEQWNSRDPICSRYMISNSQIKKLLEIVDEGISEAVEDAQWNYIMEQGEQN